MRLRKPSYWYPNLQEGAKTRGKIAVAFRSHSVNSVKPLLLFSNNLGPGTFDKSHYDIVTEDAQRKQQQRMSMDSPDVGNERQENKDDAKGEQKVKELLSGKRKRLIYAADARVHLRFICKKGGSRF